MHLKTIKRGLSYQKLVSWYSGLVKRAPPCPPYCHVTQIGDPILRYKAVKVSDELLNSDEVHKVISSLLYTLKHYKCVGLSAPQIGSSLRISVVEFTNKHLKGYSKKEQEQKEMSLFPLTVLVNPELRVTDFTTINFPEACESVIGFWSVVPRYRAVEVNAIDENGQQIHLKLKGWNARIIQHEIDHLNGKLYTDIMDRKSFTCFCWEAVNERRGKIAVPFYPE